MAGCGTCSMCCKLIEINDLMLHKEANTWCKHCIKPGCGIYDARPDPCKLYACVYLQSQSETRPLPERLRPDMCKVVIDITLDGVFAMARVGPEFRYALDTPDVKIALGILGNEHTVIATTGKSKKILSRTPAGTAKLRKLGIPDNQTGWFEG